VRSFIVISLVLAATTTAPAAQAARLPYANFKVSFSGTEATQVTGSEDCSEVGGGMAPASANETATFKSAKSRVFQFERAGRELNISPARGYGESFMSATAAIDRQSQFTQDGASSPACGGSQPNSSCGHANLTLRLLVQGGLNQVNFGVDDFKGFEPGLCLVPKAFGFPAIVPPKDYENHSKVKYSAPAPRSLLNPRKHVVVIHGSATATSSGGQEADMHVTSAVSTLKFTMRLVRVPLR
jgi:hypothetical protein